jgi:hypothetical protein
MTIVIINKVLKDKAYTNVYNTLCKLAGNDNVSRVKSKAFDFEVDFNNKKYLVKMIYNPGRHEINVNAKDYWQINKGVVSSRKSGEQMKNVYDLINFKIDGENYKKNTIKLYVIYPDSIGLMKVINECEMEFVKPKTDIYGTKMTKYVNLEEEFKEF